MEFYLVDVKNINSDIPRSNFRESDLENLADMILESGGIIKPLILKSIGVETYTVVDGHFEYYAAVRAREKNLRKGEMVNAFVIYPKEENIIVKQISAIRGVDNAAQPVKNITETTNSESSRLANIELRFEKQVNELRSEIAQEKQQVNDKLKQIESQIPKQITPLEAFNTLSHSELLLRLRSAGVTGKTSDNIIEAIQKERKQKKFESLRDLVSRIKGLSDNRMVTIIDSWSRMLFI